MKPKLILCLALVSSLCTLTVAAQNAPSGGTILTRKYWHFIIRGTPLSDNGTTTAITGAK